MTNPKNFQSLIKKYNVTTKNFNGQLIRQESES